MQSLASLMSVKPADIGNLDDFNESDEDEDRKSVSAAGRQTNINAALLGLRCDFSASCTFSSHVHVPPSALLFSLSWLLQLFHAPLTAQIAPLPLPQTSRTPLDPPLQLQVAPSCLFLMAMTQDAAFHTLMLCSPPHMTAHLIITHFFTRHVSHLDIHLDFTENHAVSVFE